MTAILVAGGFDLEEALALLLESAAERAKLRALRPVERELEAKMRVAFAKQERIFLRGLAALRDLLPAPTTESWRPFAEALGEGGEAGWGKVFDDAALDTFEAFAGPIDAAAQKAVVAGGKQGIAQLRVDVAFDLKHPVAVRYLEAVAADHVTKINEDTRKYLRTVITDGTAKGYSYDRMARAITDRYSEFKVGRPQQHIKSRAHLIAVTEAGNAYEAGTFGLGETLKAAGLRMEKSWLTVGDARVDDPICRGNGSQGWIELEAEFQSGHMRPLGHPACRCTILMRRAETPEAEKAGPWRRFDSTAAAAKWVKARWPNIDADFEGLDPGVISDSLKVFDELATKWPEVAGRMQYLGRQKQGVPHAATMKPTETFAYAYRNGMLGERQQTGMVLSPHWYQNNQTERLKAVLEKGVKSKFHPADNESPDSILTHEFGHLIHYWLDEGTASRRQFLPAALTDGTGIVGETLRAWLSKNVRAKGTISEYAKKNNYEFFAELTAARAFQKPSTWNKTVKEFDGLMRGLSPENYKPEGPIVWTADLRPGPELDAAREAVAKFKKEAGLT